jgi:hypothetical protein
MKITKTLLLLLVGLAAIQNINAQATVRDSASVMRKAKLNARTFKLSRELQQKFKESNFPSSSDYFKPTIAYTSNADLLNDSLYVQSFRDAAFYNTVNSRAPRSFCDFLPSRPPRPGVEATEPEYTGGVGEIAQKDARRFALSGDEMKKFRDEHLPNTSDYFKPNPNYTKDFVLLKDSGYVKAFRQAAFYNTLHQKDGVKIGLIVAGSITVFVTLLALFISALVSGKFD